MIDKLTRMTTNMTISALVEKSSNAKNKPFNINIVFTRSFSLSFFANKYKKLPKIIRAASIDHNDWRNRGDNCFVNDKSAEDNIGMSATNKKTEVIWQA